MPVGGTLTLRTRLAWVLAFVLALTFESVVGIAVGVAGEVDHQTHHIQQVQKEAAM